MLFSSCHVNLSKNWRTCVLFPSFLYKFHFHLFFQRVKRKRGGDGYAFLTLILLVHALQVIENDLVEARQADRSLGGQDFSRLETVIFFHRALNFFKSFQFR